MKKSFKRILGLCTITILLALSFTSCKQPTESTDIITTYASEDKTVKLTIREDAEIGLLEVVKSEFNGYSTSESCCLKSGNIAASTEEPANYHIDYQKPWTIQFDNVPNTDYSVDQAEIWLDKPNGKAKVRFWTTYEDPDKGFAASKIIQLTSY